VLEHAARLVPGELHRYALGNAAWQRNVETPVQDVLSYGAVFACATLIASDISKLHTEVVEARRDGTRRPVVRPASSVLRRPTSIRPPQFVEGWALSKLTRGNAFALKERGARGDVVACMFSIPRCAGGWWHGTGAWRRPPLSGVAEIERLTSSRRGPVGGVGL